MNFNDVIKYIKQNYPGTKEINYLTDIQKKHGNQALISSIIGEIPKQIKKETIYSRIIDDNKSDFNINIIPNLTHYQLYTIPLPSEMTVIRNSFIRNINFQELSYPTEDDTWKTNGIFPDNKNKALILTHLQYGRNDNIYTCNLILDKNSEYLAPKALNAYEQFTVKFKEQVYIPTFKAGSYIIHTYPIEGIILINKGTFLWETATNNIEQIMTTEKDNLAIDHDDKYALYYFEKLENMIRIVIIALEFDGDNYKLLEKKEIIKNLQFDNIYLKWELQKGEEPLSDMQDDMEVEVYNINIMKLNKNSPTIEKLKDILSLIEI